MGERGWRQGARWARMLGMLGLCVALAMSACAPTPGPRVRATPSGAATPPSRADFPTVDPTYIYDQLFYLATHFLHRESGFDTNLPPDQNGHDEFAAYWTQEITKDLQGFGPTARSDPFNITGWLDRPAVVPAFNQEVSVPGRTHPEQVVVIGCHYDGEAISTQSANDDASGCAIEVGVAKALGEFWRAHHTYPARTLRFVLFDAEESGLHGSFHYVNDTVNGDLPNITAMFNEEQNGIAYPLRFLGKASNPPLPFYLDLSPLGGNRGFFGQTPLTQAQRDAITRFRTLMAQAVPAVFRQFQAIGFATLAYHGAAKQEVALPIFAPDQTGNALQEDDVLGASDEVPFTVAGLPCATFIGNFSYYPAYGGPNPPPWSYPFDQAEDTIQLMNVYASGGATKASALTLALALPGMLTTWMLNQPDVLGAAPADGNPLAAIGDVGQAVVGQSLALDARAAFDPAQPASALTYAWDFGDGASASGVEVSHSYAAAGSYTLKLTVRSSGGSRVISKALTVAAQAPNYPNPSDGYQFSGAPPNNPGITIPTPVSGA